MQQPQYTHASLKHAISAGQAELVQLHINAGVPVDTLCPSTGQSLLHTCITGSVIASEEEKPHFERTMEVLCRAGTPMVDHPQIGLPLNYACNTQQGLLVRVLLASGANPDVGSFGRPPLCIAAQNNNPYITAVLLHGGANPSVVDADGHSPLYLVNTIHNPQGRRAGAVVAALIYWHQNFGRVPAAISGAQDAQAFLQVAHGMQVEGMPWIPQDNPMQRGLQERSIVHANQVWESCHPRYQEREDARQKEKLTAYLLEVAWMWLYYYQVDPGHGAQLPDELVAMILGQSAADLVPELSPQARSSTVLTVLPRARSYVAQYRVYLAAQSQEGVEGDKDPGEGQAVEGGMDLGEQDDKSHLSCS